MQKSSWSCQACNDNKAKESVVSPRNFPLTILGKLPIVFSAKLNLLYLLCSTAQSCCLASDKAKLFAKNFSKNSNLDDSGISLPVFPSRTHLKLHNISVTPKIVKKVITNFDSSKTSSLDCMPVVVQKSCWCELSYVLVELFNMYLVWRSFAFQIVGRSHWWSLYLRMLGKGLLLKTTHSLLRTIISKSSSSLLGSPLFLNPYHPPSPPFPPTLLASLSFQVFLIKRNATVKSNSVKAIHVKQQHNVAFFIFKFTLKYIHANIYIKKIHARQCLC